MVDMGIRTDILYENKQWDNYIDVWKGLAILLVILVHFDQIWSAPYGVISIIASIGARAPQFFFVISAFLTWKSIENHGIDRKFYLSRIKRLIPTYYIALVLAMLIPTVKVGQYGLGNIIAHFLFLHGFNPHWINTILGVAWYIGDLVIFYAICPVLKKTINNLMSSIIGFIITTGLSVFALILYNRFGVQVTSNNESFFTTFFFIHQLPVLMMGVVLYYLIEEIKTEKISSKITLTFSAIAVTAILMVFIIFHLNKKVLTSSFIAGLLFSWMFLFSNSIREFLHSNYLVLLLF